MALSIMIVCFRCSGLSTPWDLWAAPPPCCLAKTSSPGTCSLPFFPAVIWSIWNFPRLSDEDDTLASVMRCLPVWADGSGRFVGFWVCFSCVVCRGGLLARVWIPGVTSRGFSPFPALYLLTWNTGVSLVFIWKDIVIRGCLH